VGRVVVVTTEVALVVVVRAQRHRYKVLTAQVAQAANITAAAVVARVQSVAAQTQTQTAVTAFRQALTAQQQHALAVAVRAVVLAIQVHTLAALVAAVTVQSQML
jgi:hypothetical protein